MKRNVYIDYLKGIGIVLVVMGHCWTIPPDLYKYIYSFHMPLFFMITGYLSSSVGKYGFSEYLIQKMKKIYIPYVGYYFLSFILTVLFFRPQVDGAFIKQTVKGLLLSHTYSNINNFALWYLPLLLLASICFYFMKKLPGWAYVTLMIAFFFMTPRYQQLFSPLDNRIPLSIHVLMPALFCMGTGDIFVKIYPKLLLWNKYILGAAGCAAFLAGLYLSFQNPQQILYINSVSYLLAALLQIAVLLLITGNNTSRVLVYIGKRSLPILGMHRIFIAILQNLNFDQMLAKMNLSGIMATLLITGIVMLVCLAVHEGVHYIWGTKEKRKALR